MHDVPLLIIVIGKIVMAITAIWLFCLEIKSVPLCGSFDDRCPYTLDLTTIIGIIILPHYLCFRLFRYIWFILSIILLTSSLTYSFHSNFGAKDSADNVIIFMLVLAFIRIGWLHLLYFRRNKHDFMAGPDQRKLIGEKGVTMDDVTPHSTCKIRLIDPVYSNAEVECISDESIRRQSKVQVINVECGVLKISKL